MTEETQEKLNIPAWVTVNDVCNLLNVTEKTVKNRCYKGKFNYKIEHINGRKKIFIHSSSLPQKAKRELNDDNVIELKKYSEAPIWSRYQADKYSEILQASKGYRGKRLQEFVTSWNSDKNNISTSYSSIIRMRERYSKYGVSGLLSRYGNTSGRTVVANDYFDYFKSLYLKEGAPSLQSCWEATFGYAKKIKQGLSQILFPSPKTFLRRLEREVPKDCIYLARYGQAAWNRKYGRYVERDYSNVVSGKVWVSDHAQIDVACLGPDGNVVFPWVTAWRDYKSGKWLGWLLACGSPNSDRIFQAFYYAAEAFGLPEDVIIDNGKDYRCKDFAGGRQVIKIDTNKSRTTSMLDELNVQVHFALPYNAQTKPIERDFLKIKELISKHSVGYRGGNVVERPEKLAKEIKAGKIIPFEKFKTIFDDFIINILNKKPSRGKNLQGLSPDELFDMEFEGKITTSRDALKLFCMRTSKNFTIGRNGIKDSEFGITYWADWMMSKTGLKVYLRRDVQNYKEAWVFRADNEEFVGKVTAVKAVAALHANEISKEEFKEAMAAKKRHLNVAKSYIKQNREIGLEEICDNYKIAYSSVIKDSKPKEKTNVSIIANTKMDDAIRKNKEMEAFGRQDLSIFLDKNPQYEETLYLFETDKILEEEGINMKKKYALSNNNLAEKGVAYGY